MKALFDKTLQVMQDASYYRKIKNEVISSNIANAETPGYKAKRVDFEDELAKQLGVDTRIPLEVSDERHFRSGAKQRIGGLPQIYDDPDGVISPDGNTVDLEKEMTRLAENQVQYKALMQLINKKLAKLKYAISEGR